MSKDPISVIQRHWSHTPVPVYDIIADFGLSLDFRALDDEISGWIEKKVDGNYEIVVNKSHPGTRQRFTAAHELGHYLYHRALLGDGVGDNRAYRAQNTPKPNSAIRPTHERQANSFAANLLMPRQALANLPPETDTRQLAERFGVSEEAMRIRLGR